MSQMKAIGLASRAGPSILWNLVRQVGFASFQRDIMTLNSGLRRHRPRLHRVDTKAGKLTRLLNDADSARDGLDGAFNLVYRQLKRVAVWNTWTSGKQTLNANLAGFIEAVGQINPTSDTLSLDAVRKVISLPLRPEPFLRQIVTDHARRTTAPITRRGFGQPALDRRRKLLDLARPEAMLAMDMALAWFWAKRRISA